ncbi:MAG: MBL fold metallo-hydrolase [bacterium]
MPGKPETSLSICPLASGSKGNSYWIEGGGTTILLDAGLSMRQLSRRVEEIGRRIDEVEHIFVTHEHSDHVYALTMLLKKQKPVIWASRGTLRTIRRRIPDGARVRMMNGAVEIAGAFSVRSVKIRHDAVDPLAYRFDLAGASVAVVTDLGSWDKAVVDTIAGVDVLVCEANHDPQMLVHGPYPTALKRRIASHLGHLSNEEGATLALKSVEKGTRTVVLGHLSEANNSPSLALDVFAEVFSDAGFSTKIDVASQDQPGPFVTVVARAGKTKKTGHSSSK